MNTIHTEALAATRDMIATLAPDACEGTIDQALAPMQAALAGEAVDHGKVFKMAFLTITVEPHGDKFAVWLCDEGVDRQEIFDLYHDARAWAAGRYAQGSVLSVEDKVAAAKKDAQHPFDIAAIIG